MANKAKVVGYRYSYPVLATAWEFTSSEMSLLVAIAEQAAIARALQKKLHGMRGVDAELNEAEEELDSLLNEWREANR